MEDVLKMIGRKTVITRKELGLLVRGRPELLDGLLEAKRLLPFGRSYLATGDLTEWEALVLIVAKFFPKAVVSGDSALRLNGLLDYDPARIEVDISRSTNQRNSLIVFRRVSSKRLVGTHWVVLHGVKVRTYDPERSLAELWLNGKKKPISGSVLQNYIRRGKLNSDRIANYDREFGTRIMDALDQTRLSQQYLLPLPKGGPRVSPEQTILRAAILLYSQKGEAGLNPADVARESGVGPASVARHFPTRRHLVKAVLDSFHKKAVSNGASMIFRDDLSVKDYLVATADALMNLADQDEIGYRIQKWAIAEACPEALPQIEELCSAFIGLAKSKISEAVPTISAKEAEVRAIMFVSIVDQYTHMRWFYANLLKTEFSKHVWMQGYREMIRGQIIEMLLSPPSAPK